MIEVMKVYLDYGTILIKMIMLKNFFNYKKKKKSGDILLVLPIWKKFIGRENMKTLIKRG